MAVERDPKTHSEDWIWQKEREYRDRTSWQLTHKTTGKKIPWVTYEVDILSAVNQRLYRDRP